LSREWGAGVPREGEVELHIGREEGPACQGKGRWNYILVGKKGRRALRKEKSTEVWRGLERRLDARLHVSEELYYEKIASN